MTKPEETEAAAKVPIRMMVACAERELVRRYRQYSPRVREGKMTAAESAAEIAEQRATRNLLRILAECDQDALRDFLTADREKRRAAEQRDEVDELLKTNVAAKAVDKAFPNSTVLINERKPAEFTGDEFMGSGSDDDDIPEGLFVVNRPAVEGPAP